MTGRKWNPKLASRSRLTVRPEPREKPPPVITAGGDNCCREYSVRWGWSSGGLAGAHHAPPSDKRPQTRGQQAGVHRFDEVIVRARVQRLGHAAR